MNHRLDAVSLNIRPGFAVSIVLASNGYPGAYEKGKSIFFNNRNMPEGAQPFFAAFSWFKSLRLNCCTIDVEIFHAGTSLHHELPGAIVTNGGRVLVIAAYAATIEKALKVAYEAVKRVSFDGMVYRRDIGHRLILLFESLKS